MKRTVVKRVLSTMLTATLCLSLMTGCGKDGEKDASGSGSQTAQGSQTETSAQTKESDNPLRPEELDTIKVILFGEESARMSELMDTYFNEIFEREINTRVELMYLPWTENAVGGKVDLMIASGQEFDACIVDPKWASNSVSKGYLQDLSGVIDTYLPDWKEVMDSVSFDPYTYGDAVYAIPIGNKPTGGVFNTICVRQDIMDELGITSMSTLEELTDYVAKAKEKYPTMYATYDLASSEYIIRAAGDRNLTPLTTGLWVDQDSKELVNFAESEEFEKAVKLYSDWYKKGYLPKDMLTNTVTIPFEANMTFFMRGTCGTTLLENEPGLQQIVPTAKTAEYYLSPGKPIYKSTYENTAFQVPVSSTKADRVAMFVNLLQKNKELADAFIYGIEGTDFEYKDEKVHALQSEELFYQWMIFNINVSSLDERYSDDFVETYRHWDDEAVPNCTFGLSLDFTNIATEKAQIDAIWDEMAKPMLAGLKEYDSNIEALKKALKDAGWDKYVAEIQAQLDEHLSK